MSAFSRSNLVFLHVERGRQLPRAVAKNVFYGGYRARTAFADREAIAWLLRLASGEATVEDAEAFKCWHAQSPDHATAWSDAVRLWRALGPALREWLEEHELSEQPDTSAPTHRQRLQLCPSVNVAFDRSLACSADDLYLYEKAGRNGDCSRTHPLCGVLWQAR